MITTPPVPAPLTEDLRARVVQRAFSLTGIVPLGAFLVLHAAINARALHGDAAFVSTVHAVQRVPALSLLEVACVYVPLAVHGAIGAWLVATGRDLASPPPPYPRGVRIAVRATGVVLAAFLAMHLAELRFYSPGVHLDGGELATRLDADLSSVVRGVPWRGLAYLIGSGCATFHFAAGLWAAFAATAPARGSVRRRRWAAWALTALGAAMWLTFANVIVFRATGGQLFGETQEEPPGSSCP
jgi:succinate dehydrogenase / fumarate reductase, cytochrome b subunit